MHPSIHPTTHTYTHTHTHTHTHVYNTHAHIDVCLTFFSWAVFTRGWCDSKAYGCKSHNQIETAAPLSMYAWANPTLRCLSGDKSFSWSDRPSMLPPLWLLRHRTTSLQVKGFGGDGGLVGERGGVLFIMHGAEGLSRPDDSLEDDPSLKMGGGVGKGFVRSL
jgi:hypothetical protein